MFPHIAEQIGKPIVKIHRYIDIAGSVIKVCQVLFSRQTRYNLSFHVKIQSKTNAMKLIIINEINVNNFQNYNNLVINY